MKQRIISIFVVAIALMVSSSAVFAIEKASQGDTLRILAIGNSFSDDATMYLPDLLEAADVHNVIIARLYIGGCSLERHCREYRENLTNYKYWKSTENKWVLVNGSAGILEGVEDEPWDIVTFQQASGVSGYYSSYQPYLEQLMGIVRQHCTNPDAKFYWHQTWSYSRASDHPEFPKYDKDQEKMYKSILACCSNVMSTAGFDNCHVNHDFEGIVGIIPCGSAINYVRTCSFNDDKDLTRDGFHQGHTYGRYTLACTWFEALVRPFTGKTVLGNSFHLQGTKYEIPENDARQCQKAAAKAIKKPFSAYMTPR